MRRLLVLIVALVGLTSSTVLPTTAQDADPERTNVRYFLPYNAGGLNVGLEVVGNETGTCDVESAASPARPDAWRCFTEGGVLDPCFENPFGAIDGPAELACASSPDSGDVVLFTTTEPLQREKNDPGAAPDAAGRDVPTGTDDPTGQDGYDPAMDAPGMAAVATPPPLPWAYELANGERCQILTGATAVFAGMRVNYGCTNQAVLLGEPDESQPVWTVIYLPEDGIATELVAVTTAWF